MKNPKIEWSNPQFGYPTLYHCVYLGRAGKGVRKRARQAGLVPITAQQFRKQLKTLRGMAWMLADGTWYDTVKYT